MTAPTFRAHDVTTVEAAEAMCRQLSDSPVVGLDTETVGWSPLDDCSPVKAARIFSIQFATADDAWFVPLWGEHTNLLGVCEPLLRDATPRKVLHNAGFDRHVLRNAGVEMGGLLADTYTLDYTNRNGDREHGLKPLSHEYFGLDCPDYKQTFREPKPGNKSQYYTPDLRDVVRLIGGRERLVDYAIKDPWLTVLLYNKLRKEMDGTPWRTKTFGDRTMWDYYTTIERPFGDAIYAIEGLGVATDLAAIEALEAGLKQDLVRVEGEFENACRTLGIPRRISISSNDDLAEVLAPHLGKLTKGGKLSVAKDVLENVDHPLARIVLEHRNLTKLLKTFVEMLRSSHQRYGGRIHTSFNPCGTATGRLSSRYPNLQQIPAKDGRVRKCIVPAAGYTMGCIDMSQIEVRLAAILSGDPTLSRAIKNDWDIHALTCTTTHDEVASYVRGKDITAELLKDVAKRFPSQRKEAKSIVFGSLYGMGARKYAAQTGKSEDEGKKAIRAFWSMYPRLKGLGERTFADVQRQGFFTSMLGRRVFIDDALHDEEWVRAKVRRQAGNYPVQGGSADLLRLSMVKIAQSPRLRELGVRMILSVHDEVLLECPEGVRDEAKPIIEAYMSHPTVCWGGEPLPLPTPAEIGYGDSWASAK